MPFKINDIHKKIESKFIYPMIIDNKPIKQLKVDINNIGNISDIHKQFLKINNILNKNKKKEKEKEIKKNIKEIIKEIPIHNGKKIIINNNSNNSKKILSNIKNNNYPIKKDIATQTKTIENIYKEIYLQKNKKLKENKIKELLKSLKNVKQTNFCIKAKYKRTDFNYFNDKSWYNHENSSDNEKNSKLDYSKNSTFNQDTNLIYQNNDIIPKKIIPNNNYFYNNISFDKDRKLILPEKQKIIPIKKNNNDMKNKHLSTYTDKQIKDNNFHKTLNNNYKNNTIDVSLNNNNDKNNIISKIPRKSDFISNRAFHLTLDEKISKMNPYSKIINDNLLSIDELSLPYKNNIYDKSKDKTKDIKDEFENKRKDLLQKIHQIDKLHDKLSLNNYDNYSVNYEPVRIKNNYFNIQKKLKHIKNNSINNVNNANDSYENILKIKELFGKNNKNNKSINTIDSNILNNELKSPYRKINIYNNQEKLNDKNYIDYIIKDKERGRNNYDINLNEIYNTDKRKSKLNNNNIFSSQIMNDNYYYNQNNLYNYNTQQASPSYKKKIGLYKNYDELNYLTNNKLLNKKKPFANISLKNYINKIDDNNEISQNESYA